MEYKDYEELTKAWQDKMQEFWRDPRVIAAMMDGYANAYKGFGAFQAGMAPSAGGVNENYEASSAAATHHSTKRADAPESPDVQHGLRDAVLGLSVRVAELERELAELKAKLAATITKPTRNKAAKVCA
ncbi:MAG: hypothetical protein JSS50_03690 [Proteobacteria bacterium]|nr:hypothetical protein [Pseudomonadota bacterium]